MRAAPAESNSESRTCAIDLNLILLFHSRMIFSQKLLQEASSQNIEAVYRSNVLYCTQDVKVSM